jgi:hypothetical protein
MKVTFAILLLSISMNSYCQYSLYEEGAKMYSVRYTLDSNGTFKYNFSDSIYSISGKGTFKREGRSITFIFDTLVAPKYSEVKGVTIVKMKKRGKRYKWKERKSGFYCKWNVFSSRGIFCRKWNTRYYVVVK